MIKMKTWTQVKTCSLVRSSIRSTNIYTNQNNLIHLQREVDEAQKLKAQHCVNVMCSLSWGAALIYTLTKVAASLNVAAASCCGHFLIADLITATPPAGASHKSEAMQIKMSRRLTVTLTQLHFLFKPHRAQSQILNTHTQPHTSNNQ